MNELRHLHTRRWTLPVVVVGLVAGHVILSYFLRHAGVSRAAVSVTVVLGIALLVLAKHLGLLASLFAIFRRRFRSGRSKGPITGKSV
jgi:hypothetical protein